jgi:hypothetical protein
VFAVEAVFHVPVKIVVLAPVKIVVPQYVATYSKN